MKQKKSHHYVDTVLGAKSPLLYFLGAKRPKVLEDEIS